MGQPAVTEPPPNKRTKLVRFLKYLKGFEYFKNLIKEKLSSSKMFIENRIKKKLN